MVGKAQADAMASWKDLASLDSADQFRLWVLKDTLLSDSEQGTSRNHLPNLQI
jgi:hypothetical protein